VECRGIVGKGMYFKGIFCKGIEDKARISRWNWIILIKIWRGMWIIINRISYLVYSGIGDEERVFRSRYNDQITLGGLG